MSTSKPRNLRSWRSSEGGSNPIRGSAHSLRRRPPSHARLDPGGKRVGVPRPTAHQQHAGVPRRRPERRGPTHPADLRGGGRPTAAPLPSPGHVREVCRLAGSLLCLGSGG